MSAFQRCIEDPGGSFFLFGPRGTGKSTWLRELFDDALFIDLLAPEVFRRYSARPERLREDVLAGPATIVLDEVQRVPELLPLVHQILETDSETRFVLTGSSSRKLKQAGVDLLAGRAILRRMPPFIACELGDAFDFERALEEGMLPLVWDAARPADTLSTYVALYIEHEVAREGLVRNLGSFARFIEVISFSQGSVLNLAAIARESEVSRSTVVGYHEILEDLLLAFRVPVFTRRARRKLITKPKFYLFDCGVFRSIRPAGPLDRASEIAGVALEGLVAQHLRAWCDLTPGHTLYFWRTRGGTEVDFVVYGPLGFHAIEVKHAASLRRSDTRALRTFLDDYPEATARCLHRGSERSLANGVLSLSCEEFLRGVVPGQPLP